MGHLRNMIILVAISVAATIVTHTTEAAEYTVGDSTGWTSSAPGGASFYSDWASKIKFREGDILVFTFSGSHNVAELNDKASFDNCNVNQNKEVISTSPARVTLNHTGEFYFACTVGAGGHCNAGQKLSVSVTDGSSTAPASGPSPLPPSGTNPVPPSSDGSPPPQSPPTEPGSTTPPPSPGSATSLVATFSLVLISIVINSLF